MATDDNNNPVEKGIQKLKETTTLGKEARQSVLRYPLRKINQNLRKSLKIGTFHLVLSIILFTLAMAFIASDVKMKRSNSQKVKEQNQLFIEKQQEARRDNPNYGILAAILARYIEASSNSAVSKDEEEIRAVQTYFKNLELRNTSTIDFSNLQLNPIDSSDANKKVGYFRDNPPIIFKYTNPNEQENKTTILIPPSEYACPYVNIQNKHQQAMKDSLSFDAFIAGMNQDTACLLPSTWESLKAALIISKANLGHIKELIDHFEQIYFVSFDGIFSHRIINEDLEQLLDIAEEQPMYRWEASSYAQHFVKTNFQSRDAHRTTPYLDIAGLGIVETISIPVFDEEDKMLGVICLDKQITIEEYLQYMENEKAQQKETLVDKYKLTGYANWTYGAFDYELIKLNKEEEEKFNTKFIDEGIETNLNDYLSLTLSKNGDSIDKSQFTKVQQVKESGIFRVVLMRNEHEDHVLYISSSKTNPFREIGFFILIGFSLIILSFISLFLSARKVIAYNEKAGLANIIRNLPIGVLELETELNKDDYIKFGNDYAEEISGRVLSRFGEEPQESPFTYQSIVDINTIIEMIKHPDDTASFRRSSHEAIEEKRNLEGITTTYFAKLKERRVRKQKDIWIEVTGSPILDSNSNTVPTFGVFRKVKDPDLIKKLEDHLTENKLLT